MKIMIADDDPAFRNLLVDTVTRWEYTVVAAKDGTEAWQILQAPDAPRLVILDWIMPGMNGVELCRKIRAEALGPYVYIILLTAQQEEADLIAGMEAGADDYLTKPFRTNELKVRLNAGRRIVKLQQELAAHAAELDVANGDLEAFSYTVANNLLKSLMSIGSNARKIEEIICKSGDEQCHSYAKRIYDKTRQIGELIGTMHDFFMPMRTELRRETIDLSEMANQVAVHLQLSTPDRQVTCKITAGITVNADKNLLQIVLTNLMGNAWKHTDQQKEAVIEIGLQDDAGGAVYSVQDNGTGFDMAHLDRLFKPFQPLPGTEGYTADGIGLATVARIIRRHGGKVWAVGEPGKGACFSFTLHP